jgi:hypothetical protein
MKLFKGVFSKKIFAIVFALFAVTCPALFAVENVGGPKNVEADEQAVYEKEAQTNVEAPVEENDENEDTKKDDAEAEAEAEDDDDDDDDLDSDLLTAMLDGDDEEEDDISDTELDELEKSFKEMFGADDDSEKA